MLKIETLRPRKDAVTLELAGRVVGPWVDELNRSCERALGDGAALSVDLGGVSFVDREGIELLLCLRGRRVSLVNCTPFVAEQLKAGR